jgi:hypothetical protein
MALVTPLILLFGLAQGGAGHGTWGLWYFGLLLWFVAWLTMLVSCIVGAVAWKRTGKLSWWIVPGTALLVATGALGLWGLQG